MRLFGFGLVMVASTFFQAQAATGYSKQFIQCMSQSSGQTANKEKCLKKELKAHQKLLKGNYKNYLKVNPQRVETIKQEHRRFEKQRDQQCNMTSTGKYAKVQQYECALAMTIEQSNRYESRSKVIKR
ncbi:DUF1311 domain-containing protein [Acinetobacter sp. NCu2D-2]|uniref:lysozyme inhibitor LprI family protein n=1 Tax=Acinetobacter sp. NCu2D-2 TaxID=1608473 RepID=UPI0007CD9EFF|nr:lysozyme inhibitor LprI family protein [Acinetobacter sp. NCu2D-2]ANF81833.1 DUF1311 domain-containing protein [Acinetobacter sp. NCu2D-2]